MSKILRYIAGDNLLAKYKKDIYKVVGYDSNKFILQGTTIKKVLLEELKFLLYSEDQIVDHVIYEEKKFIPMQALYEEAVKRIYTYVPEYKVELCRSSDELENYGFVVREIESKNRNGLTMSSGEQFNFTFSIDNERDRNPYMSVNQKYLFDLLRTWCVDIDSLHDSWFVEDRLIYDLTRK